MTLFNSIYYAIETNSRPVTRLRLNHITRAIAAFLYFACVFRACKHMELHSNDRDAFLTLDS